MLIQHAIKNPLVTFDRIVAHFQSPLHAYRFSIWA